MTSPARVAIVTGSAGGIGSAISSELRTRGWLVGGLDRHPSPDCDAAREVDMLSAVDVAEAVAELSAELGDPSGLVSGAGHYELSAFTDVTDAAAHSMLRVHVGGLIAAVRAVLPGMIERRSGSIVAITSELGVGGGDRDSHYAAAKGAMLGIVRSLAVEVAHARVRVNAVAPGPTDTPLLPGDSPWRDAAYLSTLPTRSLATPSDVAACVAFLVTGGTFVTGATIDPNSGAVI